MTTRRFPPSLGLVLALMALVFGFLAGCSSDSDDDPTPSASTVIATTSAAQLKSMQSRFVADYTAAAPKMADGLTDAAIGQIAAHVCEFTSDPDADRATVITKLSTEMTNAGVKPNDEAVLKVMKFAVRDTCPQQQDELAKLI